MMNRGKVFAYVYEIDGYEVKAYLLPGTESLIQSHFEGVTKIARIGSFVTINSGGNKIVGLITSLNVQEPEKLYWTKLQIDNKDKQIIRTITISLLGQFYENENDKSYFERGITVYPSLDEEVAIPTQQQLNLILNDLSEDSGLLKIGTAYSNSDISISLNPIKLLSRHTAIVGSTGNGKSCTVTVLLKSLLKIKKNTDFPICIFDINGEYSWAFKDVPNIEVIKFSGAFSADFPECIVEKSDCIKINYKSFSRRTWRNILKPSEKTQIPALNFAIDALDYLGFKYSDLNAPADTFLASKISSKCDALISSSLCGDVSEKNITIVTEAHNLVDFLKDLKTNNCTVKDVTIKNLLPMDFLAKMICDRWAIQPGRNGYEYNAFNYGNVSSICDRIIELQRDPLFRNAFGVDGNEGISLEEIIKKTTKNKSVIILDFSSVAQEYLPCIVDSLLEQFLISALDGNYINEPHLLVLDEAHHYLKNTSFKDDNAYLGTSPGERIAKEGRKFGLHLLISTQRPRDLSSTIVSQIGTIISHALTNEQDKSIITSFGNYSDKSILNEISVLPRREAIIIGQAVSTSIRVKIDYLPENDRPKSKDPLENTFC